MMKPVVLGGDCLEVLRGFDDEQFDAIVTDPPYGLAEHKPAAVAAALTAWAGGDREQVPDGRGFMGRAWDAFVPPPAVWDECLRVLKPGGHLVAFSGARTQDLMGLSIRLAGFEIRDGLQWNYGSGFPKSLNVSADKRFCQCDGDEPAVAYSHVPEGACADLPDLRDRVFPVADEAQGASSSGMLAAVPGEAGRGPVVGGGSVGPVGADVGLAPAQGAAGRPEPGMEGRGDVQAREGQLRRPAVRPMPVGSADNGEVGRLRNGASARDGAVDQSPADADGVREPRQSRPAGQPAGEPGSLADERGSQARRGWPLCPGCGKPRVAPGLGTALKPAWEPMILARKPFSGPVAATVLAHGTGALNVDACRTAGDDAPAGRLRHGGGSAHSGSMSGPLNPDVRPASPAGRWPTNVVLSHSASVDDAGEVVGDACADGCVRGCAVAELDAQSGTLTSGANPTRRSSDKFRDAYGEFRGQTECTRARGADSGGASRFYPTFRYQAKAPARERPKVDGVAHPTVKPLGLMRWVVRLVTPPGGVVLDPFAGSGSTLQAALEEGFWAFGVEREPSYLPLIHARLDRSPDAA